MELVKVAVGQPLVELFNVTVGLVLVQLVQVSVGLLPVKHFISAVGLHLVSRNRKKGGSVTAYHGHGTLQIAALLAATTLRMLPVPLHRRRMLHSH